MERNPGFPENRERGRYPISAEDRNALRTLHKRIRREMSKEEVREKSRRICEKMRNSDWYASVQVIYGYYPLGNEVDCLPFLVQALADGKQIALPRTDRLTVSMEFYEITSFTQVKEGNFHVMEPVAECQQIQPLKCQPVIMLVPGVVFDILGNRYGYGKGYYDRYLARFSGHIKTIALAYENQMEEWIDVMHTDIPMKCIYTESRIYPKTAERESVPK